MPPMKSLLLAGSALLAAATMMPLPGQAAPIERGFTVAQAQGGGAASYKGKKKKEEKKGAPPHKPGPAQNRQAKPPAAASHRHPPPTAHRPASPHRAPPPTAHRPAPPHPVQSAPVRKPAPPRPAQAAPLHKPAPPHPAQVAPIRKPAPPSQAAPAHKPRSPTVQKPSTPPPAKSTAPAAQQKPPQRRRAGPERHDHRREAQPQPALKQAAPATAPSKAAPSKSASPSPAQKGARTAAPTVTQQPVKPHNANEFIRKNNKQPQRTIKDVRKERRITHQDGRVLIHEGDRTIVRERNRTIIRHNEDQRFAIGARDVRTAHRNGETITIVVRPDGVRIVNTTDRDGHLIRRVRRDRNGREFVIIDNRRTGPRGIFVNVPPPHIRMPRHRYVVDADRADEREIYDVLMAPPVEPLDGYYSLAQVRYNAALRDYMRRLDLDIHFDSGAWQLTPAQMDRLSLVAEALNRAIARNPREVFLIEGHTDAVGSQEDNLSLSDRRAEAVAVALTEEFHVPPENLVTQGYGEQELKVPTQGPSRANRRVAIRRITPLIDRTARR